MSGYTKLFSSILDSTVWQEPDSTVRVWITMLAMCDAGGIVSAAMPGLASRARVSLEDCIKAIDTFMAPDEWSRTKDHDGRRIVAVDGGWALLNHGKYRAIRAEDDRREYQRQLMAERRRLEREAKVLADSLATDANVLAGVSNVSRSEPPLAHASASASASAESTSKAEEQDHKHVQPSAARATPTATRFDEFWAAYPVRKGKAAALGKWKLKALDDIADTILADIQRRKTQDRDWVEGYAPHASTYVNQRGWEDDIKPINGGNHANSSLSGKLSLADRAAQLMLERDERNRLAAEATIVGQGPGRALAHDG
jgi:hypothetical protein